MRSVRRTAAFAVTGGIVAAASLLPAQHVQGLASRDGEQPGPRLVGHAGLRPGLQRGEGRLLDGVLGAREVAEAAGEDGHHATALDPHELGEFPFDLPHRCFRRGWCGSG